MLGRGFLRGSSVLLGLVPKNIIQSHTFGIWFGGFKKRFLFMTGLVR